MANINQDFGTPLGWSWYQNGDGRRGAEAILYIDGYANPINLSNREHDDLAERFASLFQWLDANDLDARHYAEHSHRLGINLERGTSRDMYATLTVADYVTIWRKKSDGSIPSDSRGKKVLTRETKKCERCSHVNPNRSLLCQNCDAIFFCTQCGRRRPIAFAEKTMGFSCCKYCGNECECGRYHSGNRQKCTICEPVFNCRRCRLYFLESEANTFPELPQNSYCNECSDFFCSACRSFQNETLLSDDGSRRCTRCLFLGDGGDDENYDEAAEMTGTALRLPTLEGRELVRKCGVELEGGNTSGFNSGDVIARGLYDIGLNEHSRQVGYHRGVGFARVETDSSVDWELIIGPVQMDNIDSVRDLNKTIKVVRDAIHSKKAKLDLRCGTHIHVEAKQVSLGQAYNLHVVYTYLEDVLYRLGSANWPIHRSLLRGNQDRDYCMSTPKQDQKTKFARTFHGSEAKYYGLNFNNYFEAMFGHCRCGAIKYGVFEDCVCNLGKCTFEFRIFNATANTIKLHAYLALCQALVAKAISMEEVKNSSDFEEFSFIRNRFKDMDVSTQVETISKWEERLEFISNLALTPEEKKSLLYCIENSELAKTSDNVKSLFNATKENN